jgi:thiol-disulfide isomerase/thioredoxin
MKHLRIIWIIALILSVVGCNLKGNRSIIVCGNIGDQSLSAVELKLRDTILVDSVKNGCFKFEIKNGYNAYANIHLRKWVPLYISENDSLHISLNGDGFIEYSGVGYGKCEYLYKKDMLADELGINDPRKIDIKLFSSLPNDFIDKVDSIKLLRLNLLKKYQQKHSGMNKVFINNEDKLINYYSINQLFKYPDVHKMLTKVEPDLPIDYFNFVEDIQTNDKVLFGFRDYKTALNYFLEYKAKKSHKEKQIDLLYAKYNLSKKLFKCNEIFENITSRFIGQYMNFNGIDKIDSLYFDFLQLAKNDCYKNRLKKAYSKWESLKTGRKAPEFEIKNAEGKLIKLSDFYGKIVYIDCWSTYCGPCIAEIPAMKKLSDEFNNEDIVFISISFDSDNKRWKKKLKEYNLNSVNLFTGGIKHPFKYDYNIKGLPRYILIDSEGTIIDATAEKPSEVKLRLKELVKTTYAKSNHR